MTNVIGGRVARYNPGSASNRFGDRIEPRFRPTGPELTCVICGRSVKSLTTHGDSPNDQARDLGHPVKAYLEAKVTESERLRNERKAHAEVLARRLYGTGVRL